MIYEKIEIVKGLQELFKYAFVTNCHLDNDSATLEESETIKTLDPLELLENFKDLILNLLNFKKKFITYEDTSSNNEIIKTRHESELQYRFLIETDLRSQLENAKIREENLIRTYESALSKSRSYNNEVIEKFTSEHLSKWEVIKQELTNKISALNDKIESREAYTKKLEGENIKLKELLEEKFIEIEVLKKKPTKRKRVTSKTRESRPPSNIEQGKKHSEEKSSELIQNHRKPNEKSTSKIPFSSHNRETNRSCSITELSKIISNSHDLAIARSHKRFFSECKQ